ncbi:MAG: hypothetical protein PHE77_00275 [Candidatus Pacebacteria bacterium]|nr:hypothetical protein [Candidatus Paceibacterota bacterium]
MPIIKIAIRDDDLSFYSKQEDIDLIYGRYFGRIPISFAVIPFVCEVGQIDQNIKGRGKTLNVGDKKYNIGLNLGLVEYMENKINNNNIYLSLHGYDHKYIFKNRNYLGECLWKDKKTLEKELAGGKNHIESLFTQRLEVFVPPDNGISKECIDVLVNLGIKNINTIFDIKKISRKIDIFYLKNLIKRLFYKVNHTQKPYSVPQSIFYFKDHREKAAILFNQKMSFEEAKNIFEMQTREGTSRLIIATHHQELIASPTFLSEFKKFLDYLLSVDNVEFVNIKEAFNE